MNLKFDKVNVIGFHHTLNHSTETTIWVFEQERSLDPGRQACITLKDHELRQLYEEIGKMLNEAL